MGDQFVFPNKKHYFTLIPVLFFISFFLILLALFNTQLSLHLLTSPSLYKNLFSTKSKVSFFADFPFHNATANPNLPISQTLPLVSEPISELVPKVSNFDNRKVENGDKIISISEMVSKDSNNDVQKAENGGETLPMSEILPKISNSDDGKGENGDKIMPISRMVPKDSNFDDGKAENGGVTVPILEGVPKDLNFDGKNGGEIVDGSGEVNSGIVGEEMKKGKSCNLYMGKWVRDDRYPVYEPGSCPYVDEAFDCQGNKRPDSGYLRWHWKPDDCDLPRFNATDFLVRLRGKRLMLVGDSMNRNQFESMLCLLREGLTDKSRMSEVHGYKITKGRGFYVFKFVDYNCSVEFVRSHFLVKEGIRINGQGNSNPTLSIDKIDKTARKWKWVDILIFNTAHWWTHGKTSRGKNYFQEGNYTYPRFDAVEAYRKALKTWAEWIDKNVDPARQLVFYRAYSSAHFRGGDWDSGGTCNGETDPILGGAFLDNYPTKMKIVEETIQQMRVPVILLNVTRLTNFRKDGHPSIYGKVRTSGEKVSARKQDCSHWCLPGVPDSWNELIYATLVLQQTPQLKTIAGL